MYFSVGATLHLERSVYLFFHPVLGLWLISLNINIINHCAEISYLVNVLEELAGIVFDLGIVGVLDFQLLLEEVAEAVYAHLDVLVVEEGP